MSDEQGINRLALSLLRPGDPLSALQAAFGSRWKPPTRRAEGYVSAREAGVDFIARVDVAGIVGSVSFFGRFPSKYIIEGVHLGMDLATALQAHPGLRDSGTEERPNWAEYREILPGAVLLAVRFKDGKIGGFDLEIPGLTYPRADVWAPAPAGMYPPPSGQPGEPFKDPNLKLVVLDALLSQKLLTLGEPEDLAMHVLGRNVDLEEEGYEFLPEVYEYLTRYPLTSAHLDAVECLNFDGSNEIYRYAFYHWDGESDEFTVNSLAGLECCRNLTEFNENSMVADTDLRPLASLQQLHTISLSPGPRTNAQVLCALPALRHFTCFDNTIPDPTILDQLKAQGVEVKVY